MKLADLDLESFRQDATGLLSEQDITILVLSAAIGRSRSTKPPYDDVAHQLGLTQGRVRHRTFLTVKTMRNYPVLIRYVEAFEELIAKKYSMFTPS